MKKLTVLALLSIAIQAEERPPNIVFIMADDLGWQDVGFMGSKYFETPNLDALASESAVFENTFMYPTCSPSRAAALTGRHSFRTGAYCVPVLERGKTEDNVFSTWTVTSEHPVYSQPLNKVGYKLCHLGKWHIVGPDPQSEQATLNSGKAIRQPGNGKFSWLEKHKTKEIQQYYPLGRGFHSNIGGLWWGDPSRGYKKGYNAPGGGYIAPFNNPFIEEKESDQWLTDRLTSEAINFIEQNKESPVFINLHYYAPHRPSVARSEESLQHFLDKPADEITGQGVGKSRQKIAAYATMVKSIDDNVKRITDYLDKSGLRENTIIIFTSDNGFNGLQSVNKNLRGAKGNVYDGGLRVPFIFNWQSKLKASKVTTPIYALDFFPTFIDLAGIKNYKELLDGDSILPLLSSEPVKERSLFWHIASRYRDEPCSIHRKGDWKLIEFLLTARVELYNTKKDLAESKNLAEVETEKKDIMLAELKNWRKQNNAPLPQSSTLEH